MNADEAFVTARHPHAFVSFNSDTGQFKVYSDRVTNIALSESCGSSPAAWSNAARAIKERDAQAMKRAERLDQAEYHRRQAGLP